MPELNGTEIVVIPAKVIRMKKNRFFWILAAFLFGAAPSYGQQNIPAGVLKHFNSAYPAAQVKDWDKERDGTYEAEFTLNGVEWEAYYDANGNWTRTERDVRRSDVPQAVWNALAKSSYAGWKVDDIEEHQTPRQKSVFEIEVKKGGQKAYLYFLPNGKMAS